MSAQRFEVVLHALAWREFQGLPKPVRGRVRAAIDGLANEPVPVGALRLKGRLDAYRIRLGDYRILYEVHAIEIVVYVVGVGHRKDVYQRLLRRQ